MMTCHHHRHYRKDINTKYCHSTQMSKIKNSGLDQYGAEPFEQQQFGTSGVGGVNLGILVPHRTKLTVNGQHKG